MNLELFRDYCLEKKGVSEGFPFGENTLVFKVGGKMFALCGIEPFEKVNLKCDPEECIRLREEFNGVVEGYHMNKTHWNTVSVSDDVPSNLFKEMIDNSYRLVLNSLTKNTLLAYGLSK